ncbi:MAG: hypothetical protein WCT20_03755, partial [Candidatus Babeliales bacterium]
NITYEALSSMGFVPLGFPTYGVSELTYIVFYDKENRLAWRFHYDQSAQAITVCFTDRSVKYYAFNQLKPWTIAKDFPLDLSKLKEPEDLDAPSSCIIL